jgi:hypothetical protein
MTEAAFGFSVASLLVAIGGLAVAIIGYRLNATAIAREQDDRKEESEAGWAREWAAQRPLVYPIIERAWVYASAGSRYQGGNARVLALKNGGRGPALNVRGTISAISADGKGYECEILAGTIASGDLLDARIAPDPGVENWVGAHGAVQYVDLVGNTWETRFEFGEEAPGEIAVTTHEPTVVATTARTPDVADTGN